MLVLPPASVSWHQVALPKVGRCKLRAVLEGLLEDRLLQEPAQIHLALPGQVRHQPGSPTWIAACDKAWLTGILQQLEQAGHPVQRILPSATPLDQARYWVHSSGDIPWISSAGPHGVVTLALPDQPNAAAPLLPLLRSTHNAATPLTCHAPATLLQTVQTLWPSLPWQLETADTHAQQLLHSCWDLAQFDIQLASHRGSLNTVWQALQTGWTAPAWRPLRWGLLGLLLVQLAGLNLVAWQERHAVRQLQEQAHQLLQQTFPHVTLVLDAPLQMQREVERLQQARGGLGPRDLETLLQTLGTSTPPWPIEQVRYNPNTVSMQHPPLAKAAQEPVVSALARQGWQVRDSSANGHTFVWQVQP